MEALVASQKAVEICKILARTTSEAFDSLLARPLNTLLNRLGESGRLEEALVASRKAVAIYKSLDKTNSEAFNHELAMYLISLSTFLDAL